MAKTKFMLLILGLLVCAVPGAQHPLAQVCFRGKCFGVEVASAAGARTRGLMFRRQLEPDKGMLFVFESEQKFGFWMKNTYLPLDIIWINQDDTVVFIQENARPCGRHGCKFIKPNKAARYVLEVNAGVVQTTGLQVGDKVKIYQ